MKFLIINGPNLNLLGSREPDIYGTGTYETLCRRVQDYAAAHGWEADCFQSNHEGLSSTPFSRRRGSMTASSSTRRPIPITAMPFTMLCGR